MMANQLGDAPKVETTNQVEESKSMFPNISPSEYGCEILLERTTIDAANDKSFPSDARLIWYVVDGVEYIDLTRCRKVVNLFDLYYDKYSPGTINKIDFGFGTVNPKLWGYKAPSDKKKRK